MNTFNEMAIPAVNYGLGRGLGVKMTPNIHIDELFRAAKVYAIAALDVCNQDRIAISYTRANSGIMSQPNH